MPAARGDVENFVLSPKEKIEVINVMQERAYTQAPQQQARSQAGVDSGSEEHEVLSINDR